jgi:adenylate cyclase
LQQQNRRLAAIVSMDVVGYSRLVGADEAGTLAKLRDLRAELIDPAIEEHGGRIVKIMGDGLLLEFASVVNAVKCSIAIQTGQTARNKGVAKDRRLDLRIGVNLGDIAIDGDDIHGDGVNVAARLQAAGEPGGLSVSGVAYESLGTLIDAAFEDAGAQDFKNIARPVQVWHWRPNASPSAAEEPQLSLPDKPSIAVLPFDNMSADPEQEYFTDGITEDIITELARFGRLFVIARNTSFAFKGQTLDVQEVARQLGVHFVLEGSVRKAGNRVRITAQLIDGQSGNHVWAERYEDVLEDIFDLQERITRQIVASMVPEIEAEEMRRLERGQRRFTKADDLSWRAWKALHDASFMGRSELCLEATGYAEEAIKEDRNCALAWQVLSMSYNWRLFYGWTDDRAGAAKQGLAAAETAIALAPRECLSYFARGIIQSVSGERATGIADMRHAHELNPNDVMVMLFLAWTESSMGEMDRAKDLADRALRMSPKEAWIGNGYLAYAMAAFVERDLEVLQKWSELAIQSGPTAPIRRVLMICYASEVDDDKLLRIHLDKLNSFAPDFVPSLFRGDFKAFQKPEHNALLLDSMLKAGFAAST